jgi:hypothetical protein
MGLMGLMCLSTPSILTSHEFHLSHVTTDRLLAPSS